jgi:hypothetical protein
VLGEVGRQQSEELAIARLKSSKRNTEERALIMNKLRCFLLGDFLAFNEGFKVWYLGNINSVSYVTNFNRSFASH